jgi:hypothetical protein
MLKPLTLSLSLAVALGMCCVSKAGGVDPNCTTCGLASPQGGPYATGQGGYVADGCAQPCAPKQHCFSFHMPHFHCPKIVHTCKYEWILKKRHCFSIQHGGHNDGCGGGGYGAPVYATGQGGVAPSGQGGVAPTGQGAAPVYGAGQHTYQYARPTTNIASAPAVMTPAVGGEEAPPAPEVKETSAIGAPTGGLLLPTPAGN